MTAYSELFSQIATQISEQGYCVLERAVPQQVLASLLEALDNEKHTSFYQAGIGRTQNFAKNSEIRNDKISWITKDTQGADLWLDWSSSLMEYLNRTLFLGLFSFESHFAHYQQGDFYKKHLDAFKGKSNRKLSLVCYLNNNWHKSDAGELLIYSKMTDQVIVEVPPKLGSLVIFLSEDFPHEVLPASIDRYSVAGWFRVNQ